MSDSTPKNATAGAHGFTLWNKWNAHWTTWNAAAPLPAVPRSATVVSDYLLNLTRTYRHTNRPTPSEESMMVYAIARHTIDAAAARGFTLAVAVEDTCKRWLDVATAFSEDQNTRDAMLARMARKGTDDSGVPEGAARRLFANAALLSQPRCDVEKMRHQTVLDVRWYGAWARAHGAPLVDEIEAYTQLERFVASQAPWMEHRDQTTIPQQIAEKEALMAKHKREIDALYATTEAVCAHDWHANPRDSKWAHDDRDPGPNWIAKYCHKCLAVKSNPTHRFHDDYP